MSDTTLEELQIRIAYQDDTISQLSDEIYRQDQLLTRLAARCHALEQRLNQLQEDAGEAPAAPIDERPPHY